MGVTPIEAVDLKPEGTATRMWFLLIPSTRSFASLFDPASWSKSAGKLTMFDLVRCRASDGSFDVLLTVAMKTGSGARMEFFAGRRPGES